MAICHEWLTKLTVSRRPKAGIYVETLPVRFNYKHSVFADENFARKLFAFKVLFGSNQKTKQPCFVVVRMTVSPKMLTTTAIADSINGYCLRSNVMDYGDEYILVRYSILKLKIGLHISRQTTTANTEPRTLRSNT